MRNASSYGSTIVRINYLREPRRVFVCSRYLAGRALLQNDFRTENSITSVTRLDAVSSLAAKTMFSPVQDCQQLFLILAGE